MKGTPEQLTRAKKFAILTALYFAQGVPFGLFSQAVPSILREGNVSLQIIGLSSLLAAPWGLKFLWSPWLDRAPLWAKERRRLGWLIPIQVLVTVAMGVLALIDPWKAPGALMAMVLVVNFLNASQDIPTDGLAVDMLEAEDRGKGNGIQVGGYRLGMLLGGAVTLGLIDVLGWTSGVLITAMVLGCCLIPLFFIDESHGDEVVSAKLRVPVLEGLKQMWRFTKNIHILRVIAVIAVFKFGDALANGMIKPMLVDFGLSLGEIGRISGGIGFTAALLGTAAGAVVADRLSRRHALLLTGIFQAIGAVIYVAVIKPTIDLTEISVVIASENFLGAMGTVVLFAYMMDWSKSEHSGMNYTILASVVVVVQGLGSILSGFTATGLGYTYHHVLAGIFALVGAFAAWTLYRENQPQRVNHS